MDGMVESAEVASRLIRIIERVGSAQRESDALNLLVEARDALGVEHAVFASLVRDDISSENFRFLVASSGAWCLEYQREGWYAQDAWLIYATTHTEPATDSDIDGRTRHQQPALGLARRFGVRSAYIVPAPASGPVSRVGVLMLGSVHEAFFGEPARMALLKPLSRSLAMELHEWWIQKIRKEILVRHRIGHLDLELLRLERAGESTKSIARRCAMTCASVDSRFQRLNAKLGVP